MYNRVQYIKPIQLPIKFYSPIVPSEGMYTLMPDYLISLLFLCL